jgi:hypothetical protein
LIEYEGSKIEDIRSDVIAQTGRFKNYYKSVMDTIDARAPIFCLFKQPEQNRHQIAESVADIFNKAMADLSQCFTSPKLSHVSPIRAYPRRFYLVEYIGTAHLVDTSIVP